MERGKQSVLKVRVVVQRVVLLVRLQEVGEMLVPRVFREGLG